MMEDAKIHEVTLTTLTYGGEAMGRLEDGRAVFIPFVLPGERVSVRLTDEKKNFARGEIVEILETSPDRIDAKCKHFGECGGCHYQNLPYEKQLIAKTEILIDQLKRIGKIENPPVKLTDGDFHLAMAGDRFQQPAGACRRAGEPGHSQHGCNRGNSGQKGDAQQISGRALHSWNPTVKWIRKAGSATPICRAR